MRAFLLIQMLCCLTVAYSQQKAVIKVVDTSQQQRFKQFFHVSKDKDIKKQVIRRIQESGFISPKLKPSGMKGDTIFYKGELGSRFPYLQLTIASDQLAVQQKDSILLPIGQYPKYVNQLLNQLSEKGRVFSKVQLSRLNIKNDSTLAGHIRVAKSKKRNISAIKLKGYQQFPVSFLKYYLGIEQSSIFNKNEIVKRSNRINELVFANQTKEPQVQFTKDSTVLYMYIEKQKSNRFEGFLGFTNDDQQDLQLNGDLDLSLVNNFNYGEAFQLQYKNNGSDQEKFAVGVELPFLFNTPFSIALGLDFFRQDSTFSTTAQHIKFEYQLNRRWRVKTGAQFYRSTSLQDEQSIVIDTSVVDYQSSKLMIGSSLYMPSNINTRLPIKNSIDFETTLGKRNLLGISNPEDDGVRQFNFKLDSQWFIPIDKRQFVYLGNYNRWLVSDNFVTNEMFRFGGMKNIRGFSENSLFANFYTVLQTEYRYILSPDLFVHSVLDLSYYENQRQKIDKNLYGLGLGVGLQTQGGLLRLIIANGNESGQNIKFDQTQFHISFSSVF